MVGGLQAQSVGPSTINATGGATIIGSNDFEWAIGEMAIVSTFTTPDIIVTQGILQPDDGTLGVPVTGELSKALSVFPNPATDCINIQYRSPGEGMLSCRLLDALGKEVSSRKITVANGQVAGQMDIRSLAVAGYMLEVTIVPANGTPRVAAYKIQKLR
jgi:hypothetical protein